jgi:hypothetical protein
MQSYREDMRGEFLGSSSINVFQQQYLSEQYYDKKVKEFFELKLESIAMEGHERIFFKLLRYVNFIQEGKVNF